MGERAQLEFDGMPEPLYAASPSRLLAWLDCPRRYRMQYLDRPRPQPRGQRAHTSMGIAVHNALRDWWDLPLERRTPAAGAELVRGSWIDVGFRDGEQSARCLARAQEQVRDYLSGVDPTRQPRGIERTVSMKTGGLGLSGRIDRLDDRDGELVVVDYKTSREAPTADDARTSLPLALYAAAVWKMFRRRCLAVELHHVPSGEVVRHEHTPESLTRKVDEAVSIARDAQAADRDHETRGAESELFPPRVSALCRWCDFRAHCPEGQAIGPEQPDWAGLAEEVHRRARVGSA
jgi:putative RecB family exonuclease